MSDCKQALVVEDDARTIITISGLLKKEGIVCKRNFTGQGVADQIQAMASKPDFILLDLTLPEIDAFDIVGGLKGDLALRDIVVIALADHAASNLVPTARRAGFDSCFLKPLPHKDFPKLLKQVLSGEPVWQGL